MFKIILDRKGYFIEVDEMNCTLKQKYIGKTKKGEEKEFIKIYGYYSNLEQAVTKYIQTRQLDVFGGELIMESYIKKIKEINKQTVTEVLKVMEKYARISCDE